MSCQGSCWLCYHRKLSLSSEGMWDICGRAVVPQSRLLKPGCPRAGWEHPGGTSPEQLRPKGQLSLAVTFQCLLDRAKDLRTAFTLQHCLWALLLSVHADSAKLWHWIAVPLQRFQEEKIQNQKTPVGVFKGFWVWDNDLQLIRWQGTQRQGWAKTLWVIPLSAPGRMCVGWRWGSKENDLECAVKRNAKQTKNPLPSVHFDCSLKPYGLCFNYWTAKICFQSAFFVS